MSGDTGTGDGLPLETLRELRHDLHRRPELAFDVGETGRTVTSRLAAAGLEVTVGVGGGGVVATLRRGTGGRTIGLRADLDGLPITEQNTFAHRSEIPGRHHGCGHDGHTTMLVGAALALAEHDDLEGQVHFVFQPDEENGRGAQAMIDDGLFERFPMDAVFGLHNVPGLPIGTFATRTGTLTAFEERFEIVVRGRGGHASAPERTVDAMLVGAQIVLALQSVVARALAPADHGVVSVTEFETDGARNVIPSTVTIRGDVRGYEQPVSETVRRRMEEISRGVAAAHGATATVRYRREFEPVVNTADAAAAAVAAASRVPGAVIDPACPPVSFSEDFAQFLTHRPGCFVLMGNGEASASLHSPDYDFADDALAPGVRYWIELVRLQLGR